MVCGTRIEPAPSHAYSGPATSWAFSLSRGLRSYDVQLRYWQVGALPRLLPPPGKPEGKPLSSQSDLFALGTTSGSGIQSG